MFFKSEANEHLIRKNEKVIPSGGNIYANVRASLHKR